MSEIKENILATLAYFDIFKYPLTSAEIWSFLRNTSDRLAVEGMLAELCASGTVYRFEELYTLKDDAALTARRYKGNQKAAEMIRVAAKISGFLIHFPYVRGVAVSGSLSKNYADEYSDIDLFIITARNRLWIARTLMHAFKKLTFLVNKQDYFCMNYYIDEQQLEILEKTTYTAVEVVTLIPLRGKDAFEQFEAANLWTAAYLPNKKMDLSPILPAKEPMLKRLMEKLFNNRFGDALDNLLLKITAGRWLKKTLRRKLNSKGAVLGMDAGKHYAKPDPKNFQHKLLKQYDTKISGLMQDASRSLAG